MARVTFTSVCFALFVGVAGSASADPGRLSGHAEMAKLFRDVCLARFPDVAAMKQAAARRGFTKKSPSQWSNAETSVNVVIFDPDVRIENPKIDAGSFLDTGWSFVSLGAIGESDLKRGETGCGILAYGVPTERLDQVLASATQQYGIPKMRSARGGKKVSGRGSTLGGSAVRYVGHTFRVKGNSGQHEMDFVSVVGRK